eukprot:2020194-Prymnesium_polylepis.1
MPCTHTQHAQHTTTVSQVENIFGGLVDAATYVENIPEGEFSAQANKGATIATNTPVSQMLADGTSNDYYPLFAKLKQFCDDDYDLVFSCSFGFMSQTSDVSSNYEPCRVGAHGGIMHCLESLVVSRASRDHLPRYLHVPRGRQPHNTVR